MAIVRRSHAAANSPLHAASGANSKSYYSYYCIPSGSHAAANGASGSASSSPDTGTPAAASGAPAAANGASGSASASPNEEGQEQEQAVAGCRIDTGTPAAASGANSKSYSDACR